MLKKVKVFLSICLISVFCIYNSSNAASAEKIVNANVDTNQIRIGEQFHLELNATAYPNTEIFFPVLPDTFNHFEIVKRGNIDTVPQSNPLKLRQQFTVTSFDSGFFVVPPFPFLVRNLKSSVADTMVTEALLMGVRTIPVDTTKEIKDIKPLMTVPYPWREKLPYLIGGLLLIIGLVYLIYRLSSKKKVSIIAPPKPKTPVHIRTIQALKEIEEQKLWQKGLIKKYHSEVSDTLRAYIEERFDIRALEQTSDETLKLFGSEKIRESEFEKLRYILQLADMVKFAKSEPIAAENEQSISYAYEFVNSTIPVQKTPEESQPNMSKEERS